MPVMNPLLAWVPSWEANIRPAIRRGPTRLPIAWISKDGAPLPSDRSGPELMKSAQV
jgi:hypothetical protein